MMRCVGCGRMGPFGCAIFNPHTGGLTGGCDDRRLEPIVATTSRIWRTRFATS